MWWDMYTPVHTQHKSACTFSLSLSLSLSVHLHEAVLLATLRSYISLTRQRMLVKWSLHRDKIWSSSHSSAVYHYSWMPTNLPFWLVIQSTEPSSLLLLIGSTFSSSSPTYIQWDHSMSCLYIYIYIHFSSSYHGQTFGTLILFATHGAVTNRATSTRFVIINLKSN